MTTLEPFDLDAARAARLEAQGERPLFLFGGQKFELPAELPAEFAYLLDTADAKETIRYLLGDQFDEFWAHRPSKEDLIELVAWVTKRYGSSLGESQASAEPSTNGGSRSRPTSRGTTAKTSGRPALGRSR